MDGEGREGSFGGGREGRNGEEAGGRKDSDHPSVRIEVADEKQIDIKPTQEGIKATCEKRQETNPEAVKKAPGWSQGGLRDSAVHDIITVALAKILRLKLRMMRMITQVNEVITVSVSPPPSTVESLSPCEDLCHNDHQMPG